MYRKVKEKYMTGTTDGAVCAYETENRKLARRAAQEGIVLLKNEDHCLPIKKGSKLALFGAGATNTIKGGTGSGDVNERETVSVYQGLLSAGYEITTKSWLEEYQEIYAKSRLSWRDEIFAEMERGDDSSQGFFDIYATRQYRMPSGREPYETEADTAIYVISRVAGEGADRQAVSSDYYLGEGEERDLAKICELYKKVIVLINSGSIIDLCFMDKYENITGLMLISQPGMEGGNAVADVIAGEVTPSGKLTDTWAVKYENYPNAEDFSHMSGDVEREYYNEGIYVGYRYFDTFDIPARYPFGYGLSYTDFEVTVTDIQGFGLKREDARILIKGEVKNVGTSYSGKEVVQIYVSCPQEKQEKEYRRLAAFHKTKELGPKQSEVFEVEIPVYALASYCEKTPGWVLEGGIYGIFAGNSITAAEFVGSIQVCEDKCLVKTEHICPIQEEIEELVPDAQEINRKREAWLSLTDQYPSVVIGKDDLTGRTICYGTEYEQVNKEAWEFTEKLDTQQLIKLVTGDPGKSHNVALGSAGVSVPGSAAQTSDCAEDLGLASVALADGPAGLRLQREFRVKNGEIQTLPFIASVEGGLFLKQEEMPEGDVRYQYCTAWPVGTMLAQTWNKALIQEVGKGVGREMDIFQITFWLAPGMNIHRNPLCGRNFEYYSEDPFLSGKIASAMTQGVQSVPGCGTTIKHFACNNQEDNRTGSDSIVSERALREIYLKGFEIAVKESQPFSIMTSYNLINGIHAANNFDLCTKAVRDEWNFKGVIMTDWTTTDSENCTASGCMRAGNDLVMPGSAKDHENLKEKLEKGTLTVEALRKSVANLVNIVWISNQTDRSCGVPAVDQIRESFYFGDRKRDASLIEPLGIESFTDISYGPYGKWNLLDVYREKKEAEGARPVIVNIHGGGWSYGDKELYRFYCMDLAKRGFTVINFNYRLSPEHQFPAGLEDTNAVFVWMTEHAKEYELDLDNVFVVGDSAGAQMNTQYMTLLTNEAYRQLFDFEVPHQKLHVKGCALNCGIYDMKQSVTQGADELYLLYLKEALAADREKAMQQVDVLSYLTADFPPAFVMTASHDFLRPFAKPMKEKLEGLGVPAELHEYGTQEQEYMQHVFHCNLKLKEAVICNDEECEFFKGLMTEN